MKRFLVTGGAGFIGSHLVRALLDRGDQVRVLDDLSTGKRDNLPPDVELLVGCVTDPALAATALAGTDGCFHLAAIASVERCRQDPIGTNRVNLGGAINLLSRLAEHTPGPDGRRPGFVQASSAAVYGDAGTAPIDEQRITRPLSAYGADKRACELHAAVATHNHVIPSVSLRFFNVYGPRQDPHSPYSGVISIFADRIARGEPVTVYGDGGQTRDFIHVSAVAAALLAAMDRQPDGAPAFNVCTGRATTVRHLAETIARICGREPAIAHGPARAGEIRHSLGNPAALRASLGGAEPIGLEPGLRDLLGR